MCTVNRVDSGIMRTPIQVPHLADRLPGARVGRLVGEALAGIAFPDGTELFAANWCASPAGPFREIFRTGSTGRRELIVDSERGSAIASWRHAFDSVAVAKIEWHLDRSTIRVCWSEGAEPNGIVMPIPEHLGFQLATATLRRLPERWLLGRRFSGWTARCLDAGLSTGLGAFVHRTENGVLTQALSKELRAGLMPRYERAGRDSGSAIWHRSGANKGGLLSPSRPIYWRGELWYVPPQSHLARDVSMEKYGVPKTL